MMFIAFLSALALAGPADDLSMASDDSLSEDQRMVAFDRLVMLGATDTSYVSSIATTEDADSRQRWVAIRVLGMVRGPKARDTLYKLLEDPQPAMRAAAAGALGDFNDPAVVSKLTPLLEDPAIIVRAQTAEALGKLGSSAAVKSLSDALMSNTNYHRGTSLWVRKQYVMALGQIGSQEAVPALLRALDDADRDVSFAALQAFEQVARFSYADGRTAAEEKEAWRRWASSHM